MKEGALKIVTKVAASCSPAEFGAFVAFVRAGGEVSLQGLAERIQAAPALAFAYLNNGLVGISALKVPVPSYRSRVSKESGVQLSKASFPFELGWVYLSPEARGKKLSFPLSNAALASHSGGVFATSRTDNAPMHNSLIKLGFVAAGKAFQSGRGEHSIQVFVRSAAQPSLQADGPASGGSAA